MKEKIEVDHSFAGVSLGIMKEHYHGNQLMSLSKQKVPNWLVRNDLQITLSLIYTLYIMIFRVPIIFFRC